MESDSIFLATAHPFASSVTRLRIRPLAGHLGQESVCKSHSNTYVKPGAPNRSETMYSGTIYGRQLLLEYWMPITDHLRIGRRAAYRSEVSLPVKIATVYLAHFRG